MDGNAFRKEQGGWLVAFDGRTVRLGYQKGAEYIATLLARPGDPIHVLDLSGRAGNGDAPPDLLSERARKAVTNRIRDTISRIAKEDQDLARHLRTSVRTGTFCRYAPGRTFEWDLGGENLSRSMARGA